MRERSLGSKRLLRLMGGFGWSLGLGKLGNTIARMLRGCGSPLWGIDAAEGGVGFVFDPFLRVFGIWAIPYCVLLVFPREKTVLPSLPLVLVFVLVSSLGICFTFGLSSGHIVWACLR